MERKNEMAIEYCCGAFNRECFQPGVVSKVRAKRPVYSAPALLILYKDIGQMMRIHDVASRQWTFLRKPE